MDFGTTLTTIDNEDENYSINKAQVACTSIYIGSPDIEDDVHVRHLL